MKYKQVVFFDIDHTVFDPIRHTVPKDTVDAFRALHARGDTLIAVATGRALYMLDVIAPVLPFIDVSITINGQIIAHQDTILFDQPMSSAMIKEIRAALIEHKLVYGYIGAHGQGISQLDAAAREQFALADMPLPQVDPEYYRHHRVYQMWAFANKKEFENLAQDLPDYQLVPWLSDGFDVVLTGRSKKDGIAFVLEHFNIPLAKSYAFGDGMNDLEMLTYVPNSVAMGNSKPPVKAAASFVTTPYDEGGIARGLRHFGLID